MSGWVRFELGQVIYIMIVLNPNTTHLIKG